MNRNSSNTSASSLLFLVIVGALAMWGTMQVKAARQAAKVPPAAQAVALATATLSPAKPSTNSANTNTDRSDRGAGNVTVVATWLLAPAKGFDPSTEIGFEVKLDTHSVELGAYDLSKIITLRDGAGREYAPLRWTGVADASHHRDGIIAFARADEQSRPLIAESTQALELVVRDVAGIKERVLRWDDPARLES